MDMMFIDYLARFGHMVFGVTWIGLLYYFNFVQTEYFKEAEPAARVDAFSKLAPRALWWFRWGAMGTFRNVPIAPQRNHHSARGASLEKASTRAAGSASLKYSV